jgi:hypothetical protein
MQALIEQIKSPAFWVLSVVAGFVINVLSNLVTPFVGNHIRIFSTRSREKRDLKKKHITDWIDGHQNGAVLVLLEAHFLSFLGMSMIALVIGLALLAQADANTNSDLLRIFVAVGLIVVAVAGMAAMNIGGTLLEAVQQHPKGLKGLFPIRAKPKE